MSKRVHGNKEAKKPKQVPAVLPPPSAATLTPLPLGGRKPPQARK